MFLGILRFHSWYFDALSIKSINGFYKQNSSLVFILLGVFYCYIFYKVYWNSLFIDHKKQNRVGVTHLRADVPSRFWFLCEIYLIEAL